MFAFPAGWIMFTLFISGRANLSLIISTINLNIPYDRKMTIQVYNSVGQEVNAISINKYFTTGTHSIYWNGSKYPSGVYYIKFSDGFETKIQKILLLK